MKKITGFFRMIRDGDLSVKLSCILMGFGNIRRGQILKGLFFFACEVLFFLFFFGFGLGYLRHFGTLGENAQLKVWDEELQIYKRVPGDNSMLILLFSVLTIMVILLFICLWVINVRSAYKAYDLSVCGKKLPSMKDDLKSMLDERFHITLLSAPMTTLLLFTLLPIIFMVLIAFTNFDANHQPPGNLFTWTGMQNVTDIFLGNATKTNTFLGILGWTFVWAIFATFTNYVFGMLLALLINHKLVKLKKMWRTWFMIPIAIPQFVSLLLISRALEPSGAINVLLQELHLTETPVPFLTDPTLARITVIVINMWIGIPYTMMTFSGVLMNIPADLYESAAIDGAGPVRRFFSITFPYMIFVTAPATITTFVGNVNNFNVIYLLTAGGPASLDYYQAGKTDLLVTWLYKLTVDQHDYALASTIGIFIFMIVSVCSLAVYNRTGAVKKEDMFQ